MLGPLWCWPPTPDLVTAFYGGAGQLIAFFIDVDGPMYRKGQVRMYSFGSTEPSESFAVWLAEQSTRLSRKADALEKQDRWAHRHWEPLPSTAPSVSEASAEILRMRAWWHGARRRESRPYLPPNQGATQAELREAERALGLPLAAEHKELLRVQRLLSVLP